MLTFVFAAPAPRAHLEPLKFVPLPLGSITPTGWLQRQLALQADGLSGHLAQFWPDVSKSVWIGGGGDGGLHERTPYWLNGIVPLAYLLRNAKLAADSESGSAVSPTTFVGIYKAASNNSAVQRQAGQTRDPPRSCGVRLSARVVNPTVVEEGDALLDGAHDAHAHSHAHGQLTEVDLLGQVACYIEYILSHQAPDGWLGPLDKGNSAAPWGRSNVMLALAQYAEAEPSMFRRVTSAMLRYLLSLRLRLSTATPLGSWAAQRWQDLALGVQWLLEHAPQGHEAELLDLLRILHSQGSEWEECVSWSRSLWSLPLEYIILWPACCLASHIPC